MPEKTPASEKIHGWDSIAGHLGCAPKTARKRAKLEGLKVHRDGGGPVRPRVFAYAHELDLWKQKQYGSGEVSDAAEEEIGVQAGRTPELDRLGGAEIARADSSARPVRWRAYLLGLVALALLALTYRYVIARRSATSELSGPVQLTANGREKSGLVTDGRMLYFGQEQDGWFALAAMPVAGGPIRILWKPQENVRPVDVSPDGSRLLALVSLGVEREQALWIVPLGGGEPHLATTMTAHAAAWAPDGKRLAFASGNRVYLLSDDGRPREELGSFADVPQALLWSSDGKRLRFDLADSKSGGLVSWGEFGGPDLRVVTDQRLREVVGGFDNVTRMGSDDRFLVPGDRISQGSTEMRFVTFEEHREGPSMQITPGGVVGGSVTGIAFVAASSRLFALDQPVERTSFASFDPRTGGFKLILPGVSGTFLDYSRDGRWIAYASFDENSLWVSRPDGSEARQLTFLPDHVELPRWSPDGQQIAYMYQSPGKAWRIFVRRLDDGTAREASPGFDDQGAPTWSPDGRSIIYGGVRCEATNTCAVHRIDLASGKVQTIPGSEGLFTARMSPDGQWIAAISMHGHQLMLFDVKSEMWRQLAEAIDGTDLSWSADSRYIYANVPGAAAGIIRVRVADGRRETVLDLVSQYKFNMAEVDDLQFTVAPDGAVILHRRVHSQEIYAYDLRGH